MTDIKVRLRLIRNIIRGRGVLYRITLHWDKDYIMNVDENKDAILYQGTFYGPGVGKGVSIFGIDDVDGE